ncbi:MAG: trypsin-like serine protease [Clostridiales bacterium]|nr:trypsin-like serine protease [Clostridiales bacterium]
MRQYYHDEGRAAMPDGHRLYTPPPGPPARPPRRRRPLTVFFLFLLLFCGLLTALILLARPAPVADARPGWIPEDILPSFPPTELDWQDTTIPRAPTGTGAVLQIAAPPEGGALPYQDIYRANIPSIVFLSAGGDWGVSQGSGVILSEDGYVITNAHIIQGCAWVDVTLEHGEIYDALLVGYDPDSDLAVLKIETKGLTPAVFGDSDLLQVGDVALAIGNPLGEGLRGTLTDGIISAINRGVQVEDRRMVLIQTTAALNSGNSGGALISEHGQVVGITNLKMSSWYESIEGLGFAIPTTTVKAVADALIAHGHVSGQPVFGVTVAPSPPKGYAYGLLVYEVAESSDAWAQGIRPGDFILEADGAALFTNEDLLEAKEGRQAGDTVTLLLLQGGRPSRETSVTVRLVERYTLTE